MLCIHERGAAPFIFQVAQCQLEDSKGKCYSSPVKDCYNTVGYGSALLERVVSCMRKHGLSQESKLSVSERPAIRQPERGMVFLKT